MRICIVATGSHAHGIGGMQQHTVDLARGLTKAGHEVVTITTMHPEGVVEEYAHGAHWRFLEGTRRNGQDEAVWLRRSYEEFACLHRRAPFDIVQSQSTAGQSLLMRGVHRHVPFVVTFHGAFFGLTAAALRRAVREPQPLNVCREGRHVLHIARRHFRHGKWYRFRACEAIVPSRQQLDSTRRSCLIPRDRIHVVPNGIDVSHFSPRPRDQARADVGLGPEFHFVCVGRLSRDKGVHHAIRALAEADSVSRLVVVGDGEERARLEVLARDCGVRKRVMFAGAQPVERIPLYLSAADCFLFPTERDEAAPLVLPQAMACGLPVVASRTGGIDEVLGDSSDYGLLVPPGDRRMLVASMKLVLRSASRRHLLGAAARHRVLSEYTLEKMIARTLAVYDIAAARPRGPVSTKYSGAAGAK